MNNYTCPFCGRKPEKIVTSLKDETYRVKCPCECMGPPGYTPEDATRKWNNREPLYINPFGSAVRIGRNSHMAGDISILCVENMLQSLVGNRVSGMLQVISRFSIVSMCIADGKIVAASGGRPIGEILKNENIVSDEELEHFIKKAQESEQLLGQVLIESEKITQEQLNNALKEQIVSATVSAMQCENGTFIFRSAEIDIPEEYRTDINAVGVIMEASRRVDESGS
ncbi:MAG: DUF4388 domain-containing protein [Desulfobacterales bacterium]|nr:DUF4388 domain-containing protein [Desulfobacterales bacterium]